MKGKKRRRKEGQTDCWTSLMRSNPVVFKVRVTTIPASYFSLTLCSALYTFTLLSPDKSMIQDIILILQMRKLKAREV